MDGNAFEFQQSLPPELRAQAAHIEAVARASGLDFPEVVFVLLDSRRVNGVAAYGGFPVRYPSWRFGMEFERLDKGYEYGLSKIYELVINNDPVYAYLVGSNTALEQKLVMAHVFAHADFFTHNCWFQATDRRMLDTMAAFSTRIRRYIDKLGREPVEQFLDRVLSIDNLIDPYLSLRASLRPELSGAAPPGAGGVGEDGPPRPARLPTHDVLGYVMEHARLEEWQRDMVRIVRGEAYYFQPQRMTKIANEGWASYWHSRLLTGGLLLPSEVVEFADRHSSATVQAPGQLNPYKLGIELYRHAAERELDLFRLRRVHNDASLIDELFDEGFCARNELFLFGRNPRSGRTEVLDRDWRKVKERLLQDLSWGGLPQIELAGVDGEGGGRLALVHRHDGRDLQLAAAGDSLRNLSAVWGGPVELATLEEGQGRRLRCEDGEISVLETQPESGCESSGDQKVASWREPGEPLP